MRLSLLLLSIPLVGFAQDSTRLTFDVASIRPNPVRTARKGVSSMNGVLSTSNVSLRQLLGFVYHVEEFQILGGPAWFAEDGWDIQAKMTNAASPDEGFMQRVENLFADRFGLVFHWETRQDTVYELGVEKNGHKLEGTKDGVTPQFSAGASGGLRRIAATGIPVATMVLQLSRNTGQVITDKTGLSGPFNWKLEWAPEIGARPGVDGPSIFTAVREQLGLRLDAVKAPVRILVVDKVERASEN